MALPRQKSPLGLSADRVLDLSPASFHAHPLHDPARDWPETNCYVDLWIEVLHGLGREPLAGLGFTVAQDFEGDHFTFFKFPLEDVAALYGIAVQELAIYDTVERHTQEQIGRGRLALIEVDAFYLPDTRGVSYGLEHSKTTIAANRLDPLGRSLDYFHNAGFFSLEGEDFDGVFQRPGHSSSRPDALFPYVEFAKFNGAPLKGAALVEQSLVLLQRHLALAPTHNPVRAFAQRIGEDILTLVQREPAFFHKYAFNTLRQLGANFELLASHLAWLSDKGVDGLDSPADTARAISSGAKVMQFQLARAVNRKRTNGLPAMLDGIAAAWDQTLGALHSRFA
jgi:hypothetical protein